LLLTKNWGSHGLGDPGSLNASCKNQLDYDSGYRVKFKRRITARHKTFGLGFGKIESGKVKAIYMANGFHTTIVFEF
jgi:hypothetical protein